MIDYQTIIENLQDDEVIEMMKKLGVDRYEVTPKYLLFPTICHNESAEEASMKLYYYKDTHIFYCYTECGGMTIFKFLEHFYKTRGYEYDWYNDIYQVVLNCSNMPTFEGFTPINDLKLKDRYKKKELIDLPIYDDCVLDIFENYYPVEWLSDNISPEAMDKFGIKYSISQNKIIIPHYNVDGKLVGIRGRALNPKEIEEFAKYAPIKVEQTIYKHPLSMNLYGLYENKENIKHNGIVYIAESEKSCLQAEGFSGDNCVIATCGSSLNLFHIKLLMKECCPQEIILCYDQEEKENSDKYFNKLYKMCQKYSKYCNISFIYDREHLLDLKDSPFDKGEEVFRKLVEKRVRVK